MFVNTAVVMLAFAGAQAPSAQTFRVSSDANPPVAATVASLASSGYSLAPLASGRTLHTSFDGAATSVAAGIAPATGFAIEGAGKPRTAGSGGSGVKVWMLVAMGLFLIGTISQRRVASMTD